MRGTWGVVSGTLLFFGIVRPGCAGIYDPFLLCPFDLDDSSLHAVALPFENFAILFNKFELLRRNTPSRDRESLLKSVHDLLGNQHRTINDDIKLTAMLLELGEHDQALGILLALSHDPTIYRDTSGNGFIIYAHFSMAFLGQDGDRSELRSAYDAQQSAIDLAYPQHFADLTSAQLHWVHKVEKEYVFPWLKRRMKEGKTPPLTLAPLFCHEGDRPLRFVCADGVYRANEINPVEQRLLPPDAIAIVQQMLLWNPGDTRMLWLLGELYNATADVRTASRIFQICIESRGFSPPELVQHRKVLLTFLDEQDRRLAEEIERRNKEEENRLAHEKQQKVFIGLVVGLVVAALAYFQVREFVRRIRRKAASRTRT